MNIISKIYCSASFFLIVGTLHAQRLQSFDDYFKGSTLGPVQKKESEHFKVSWVHPRDALLAEALLEHMEAADKDLAPLFRDASGETAKTPIEIFPDLKTFSAVSKLPIARFKATGTIALTLDQRLMLLSPRNLASGYPWIETATHEFIHYLIREIDEKYIPIWLHEGVAQFYQGYPYRKHSELRPAQWGLFKKAKLQKKWLDLKTLQEPFPYRKDPEEAELAYIEALLFVQWIDKKCGNLTLIRNAGQMKSLEGALEKCTGWSYSTLESKFIPEILAKVAIPVTKDVEFYSRDFSGSDPREREGRKADRAAKNFAQLSSELFDQGRFLPASLEMQNALKSTDVAPPSWRRQLALSLRKINQSKNAVQVLEGILLDYPEDAATWQMLGQMKLAEKDDKEAWQKLIRAFAVNPFLEGLEEDLALIRQKNPSFTFSGI